MARIVIAVLVLATIGGCATLKPSQGPILRVEHAHLGGATVIAFSPSGEWLASAGHDGSVAVWHVPDGERMLKARMHRRAVRGLVWLDDQTVASAAEDGIVSIWRALDGNVLRNLQSAPVTAMVYDRSRDLLITGHTDGTVRMLDAQYLRERRRTSVGVSILALAYDPINGKLAVAAEAGRVLLLKGDLSVVQTLRSPREVKGLTFSPDGDQLAGGAWFELLVWHLDSGKLSIRDTEHLGAIIALDFTPNGRSLATIGRYTDGGVRLVDAADNHVVRRLLAHRACGWSVRVSPNGRYLATASEDESIRIYDLQAPYEPKFQHDL